MSNSDLIHRPTGLPIIHRLDRTESMRRILSGRKQPSEYHVALCFSADMRTKHLEYAELASNIVVNPRRVA